MTMSNTFASWLLEQIVFRSPRYLIENELYNLRIDMKAYSSDSWHPLATLFIGCIFIQGDNDIGNKLTFSSGY